MLQRIIGIERLRSNGPTSYVPNVDRQRRTYDSSAGQAQTVSLLFRSFGDVSEGRPGRREGSLGQTGGQYGRNSFRRISSHFEQTSSMRNLLLDIIM